MSKDLFVSGVIYLQEVVGFDVVSIWSQSGYLAKASFIFAVLAILFILGYMLSKAFK
ncbi:MAG TPA: hypothetical protein VMB70_01975 [Terriglobia bacterium]|nr:hypothetical protein [Terriglobia bacterium]